MADTAEKPKSGWLNVLVDYGPLVVFLAVYWWFAPDRGSPNQISETVRAVVTSTGAFIVAALIALGLSKWLTGTVSRMLMLSTVLIVGFGGLTILLRDPFYVQIKPTVLYAFFGIVLLAGWLRGQALLQWLLEAAFEGLEPAGWLKLSRNWGFFFLVLAVVNETLRHYLDFGDWLTAKFWVFLPLTFLFTFSQVPMLLKHGLDPEKKDAAIEDQPPTGE
ncbi:inner membrane-spanning protein YciB [Qipengyuania sp. JC766]|uniref:inner membrane-spanning protein YciB n=1 Tax=Qipengyuania sp. JC766 TaxID=3232139 RepID=UPI0034589CE5